VEHQKLYKVYTLSIPMHLYTLTRGIKSRMNEWENDLSAQWMPLKYKRPDGTIINSRVKLAIREVKLHEIVFPKEYESIVMGLLNPMVDRSGKGYMGKWGKIIPGLAKFLGLKRPIKKWKHLDVVESNGVACMALGTKEDIMNFDISEDAQSNGFIPKENL